MTTLTRPAAIEKLADEWFRTMIVRHMIVLPDKFGRYHRSQLDGVHIREEVRDGWTWLTLDDNGVAKARARWRYDESLNVEWETLP